MASKRARMDFEHLRGRAETALRQMRHSPQVVPKDMDALVHDLEVYHVELDIQHQALKEAYRELERSQQDYQHLFTYAPLSYLILNRNGIIKGVNRMSSQQFGIPIEVLMDTPLAQYVDLEHRGRFHISFRRVLNADEQQSDEFVFIRRDGTRFHAAVQFVRINANQIEPLRVRVALTDVTERTRYEQRLRGLRELDQAILRSHSISEIAVIALHYLPMLTNSSHVRIRLYEADMVREFSQGLGDAEPSVKIEPRQPQAQE